jgi:phosphotransferase system HPr-like phosphotransfer protein
MPRVRIANTILDSNIQNVITITGNDCGSIGPRFIVIDKKQNTKEMPPDQLADFLNDTTGRSGGPRVIDENMEQAIITSFHDVIYLQGELYIFQGPKSIDIHKFFSKNYNEAKEEESFFERVNMHSHIETDGTFTKNEAQAILQHEVAITNSNSQKPILGSYGAGPCIIVAAYNVCTTQTILAHIDSLTSASSINAIFKQLQAKEDEEIHVHIYGGDEVEISKKVAKTIINIINSQNNTEIISANVCNGGRPKRFAIDSRSGEIFTKFSITQLDHAEDSDKRLQLVRLQFSESALRLSFDGTKETYPEATNSYQA